VPPSGARHGGEGTPAGAVGRALPPPASGSAMDWSGGAPDATPPRCRRRGQAPAGSCGRASQRGTADQIRTHAGAVMQ